MTYPDLSKATAIAIDIESYDPQLPELGPGVYRQDGNVLGIALAIEEGFSEYYNVGHPHTDRAVKQKNIRYLKDVLALPNKKIGTNLLYDLDWIQNGMGIPVKGELHDVQLAEPLLNENQRDYSLEALSLKYCREQKRTSILREWCDTNGLKGDPRKHIYLMPYELVREYAIMDAVNPLEIFQKQWKIMKIQNLLDLYHMEMSLYPLLLQMRSHGVRISDEGITEGIAELTITLKEKTAVFQKQYGKVNYNSSKQLGALFDQLRIEYPRHEVTPIAAEKGATEGSPWLDADVLAFRIDHPVAKQIIELREIYKIRNTFFINSFTGHNVNGRIHCSFHPNKTEEYGTKSGRFSSSNPNLQQIPSRDETYGTLCRQVFLPELGMAWGKIDYNQIEYRLMAHYAVGPKSEDIRQQYNENPDTDYHQMIMDLTGLTRKRAKSLNFGMAYLMGARTMNRKFGWPLEECQDLIDLYNREVPFIKATRNWVVQVAKSRGYIRTILNRRARITPEMIAHHKEFSMFNRLIQGSAADLLKKAMSECYKAGVFDILVLHLTVHDELDFSIPPNKEGAEAAMETKRIMESCMELNVPIVANLEAGIDWGHATKFSGKVEELKRCVKVA